MNKITIIGNLTGNPESRMVDTGNGGIAVCNFTVATNRISRGQKTVDYFRVSCWRKQAENAMKYLAKGRKVAVVGMVTARAYMGNDGSPKASLEVQAEDIEYLSSRQDDTGANSAPPPDNGGYTQVDDEELPF